MHALLESIANTVGIAVETAYLLVGTMAGIIIGRLSLQGSGSAGAVQHSGAMPVELSSRKVEFQGAELAAVNTLLDQGNMIAAIKEIRDKTGLGLKEAKDLAEVLKKTRGL